MIQDVDLYDKAIDMLSSLEEDITGEVRDILMNDIHDILMRVTMQFNPHEQIALIWSVEDVQTIRDDLTEEQAMDVLNVVERRHDADIGVNWDTLEYWIDELYHCVN